jgi:hypothetical protein
VISSNPITVPRIQDGRDRRPCRHVGTNTVTVLAANPHRLLTAAEVKRRQELAAYLDVCSEDELIEEVLLPLFRQLGFHRITAAGHKDKALEYGKDVWMRYTSPTQHFLYFGVQAKGKMVPPASPRPATATSPKSVTRP